MATGGAFIFLAPNNGANNTTISVDAYAKSEIMMKNNATSNDFNYKNDLFISSSKQETALHSMKHGKFSLGRGSGGRNENLTNSRGQQLFSSA